MGGTALASGALQAGSRDSGESYGAQLNQQRWFNRAAFGDKMSMAKQYGIHPLAMLGQKSETGRAVNVGSPGTDYGLGRAGQAAGQAIANIDKSMDIARIKLLNKQAEYYDTLSKKLVDDGQSDGAFTQQDIYDGQTTWIDKNIKSKQPEQTTGIRDQRGAAELGGNYMDKISIDRNNYLHWSFPKDIAESVESKTSLQIYDFIRETRHVVKRYGYWEAPWLPGGDAHRRMLRKARGFTLRAARAAGYVPHGFTVRYDANNGAFRVVKDDGKNYLYTDKGMFSRWRFKVYPDFTGGTKKTYKLKDTRRR